MKVLTHRPLPSRVMLMSTGKGILAGSPIVATSFACHSPLASCFTSQILEVSAVAATAQLSPGFKDQRISSGATGTVKTFCGFMAFKSHSTMVLPKSFIACGSFTPSHKDRITLLYQEKLEV